MMRALGAPVQAWKNMDLRPLTWQRYKYSLGILRSLGGTYNFRHVRLAYDHHIDTYLMCMCIYMYIYICVCTCVCVSICTLTVILHTQINGYSSMCIYIHIYYTYCLSIQLSILSILFILVIYLSDVGMCISYNKRSITFTIGWINMFIAHIYIYMYIHFCMHMSYVYKYVCIDIYIYIIIIKTNHYQSV